MRKLTRSFLTVPLALIAVVPMMGGTAWAGHGHSSSSHHERPGASSSCNKPAGEIRIQNRSGTRAALSIDGKSFGTLASGEVRTVPVSAGQHVVEATYQIHGTRQRLVRRSLSIHKHDRDTVTIQPATTGLLKVKNDTGRAAVLYVNGRRSEHLQPGEVELVSVPLGHVDLRLEDAAGRYGTLDRASLRVDRYDDEKWMAAAPRYAELVVDNPLPIPVRATVAGESRTIGPRARTTFDGVPVGGQSVTLARLEGEQIARTQVGVDAYGSNRLTVPAPSRGIVEVENEGHKAVTVFVDGRQVATLAPDQEIRLDLALGRHEIEAYSSQGREVLDRVVRVDPYDEVELEVERSSGQGHGGYSHHQRPDDDDRYVDISFRW